MSIAQQSMATPRLRDERYWRRAGKKYSRQLRRDFVIRARATLTLELFGPMHGTVLLDWALETKDGSVATKANFRRNVTLSQSRTRVLV